MKEIFYYFGIMCFGYGVGIFCLYVAKMHLAHFKKIIDKKNQELFNLNDLDKLIINMNKLDNSMLKYNSAYEKYAKPEFAKQMLESDKELQKACKNQYYIMLEGKKYKIVKPFTFD